MSSILGVLRRHPVIPSMLTYSVLYPGANLVQQKYFRSRKSGDSIDWKEVSRFFIYGGLFHAPLVHNWLRFAAKLFPKETMSHLLAKVAMDQTCFAPVALTSFYVGLSVLEGKDKEGVYNEWIEKFPNTWATGIFIWTFLQAFNFRFVPSRYRTIFVGVCGFFWFTFLAYLKSLPGKYEAPVIVLYKYLK